jgi:hypothetical protein
MSWPNKLLQTPNPVEFHFYRMFRENPYLDFGFFLYQIE